MIKSEYHFQTRENFETYLFERDVEFGLLQCLIFHKVLDLENFWTTHIEWKANHD